MRKSAVSRFPLEQNARNVGWASARHPLEPRVSSPSVTGGKILSLRAERSNLPHHQSLDCFVVSLLAMTHALQFPPVSEQLRESRASISEIICFSCMRFRSTPRLGKQAVSQQFPFCVRVLYRILHGNLRQLSPNSRSQRNSIERPLAHPVRLLLILQIPSTCFRARPPTFHAPN